MRRVDRSVVAALLLALACSCTATPRPVPPPPPAPTSSVPATTGTFDEPACAAPFPAWRPDNPPSTGGGPHPILLVVTQPDDVEIHTPNLAPPALAAAVSQYDHEKAPTVELLACIDVELWTEQEASRATCEYDIGGSVDLLIYGSTYRVSVREAATGRELGRFEIAGNRSDENSCPVSLNYLRGEQVVAARAVNSDSLTRRLQPYIDG